MKRHSILLSFQDLVIVFAFVSLVAIQMGNMSSDPGLGWHIRTGEFVAQNFYAPLYDPFLSSDSPRPWISDQWLSDLLFYVVFSFGGWPLLYAFITLIYMAVFFLVLYPAVARFSKSCLSASFAVFLAFKIAQIHFFARPVVIGFLFFAIVFCFCLWLWNSLEEKENFKKALKRSLFLLPALFLLWANMHPSFVMGGILLALVPFSLIVDDVAFGERKNRDKLLPLVLLVLLCGAATFINPYHYTLHLSILSLGQSDFFMNYHMEWLSPDFKNVEGRIFQLMCGVILLSYFFSKGRMKTFPFLSLLVFALLGMRAVRVLPYFGIVASYPFAAALTRFAKSELFTAHHLLRRLSFHLSNLDRREENGFRGKLALWTGFFFILVGALFFNQIPGYRGTYGPSPEEFPLEALAHLRSTTEEDIVLGSFPGWGGYITLKGYPAIRAVIDDRNTLLGEQFYKDFHKSLKEPLSFVIFMRSNGATHLLLPKEHMMGKLLRENEHLEVVFSDDVAIVFSLNESTNL